MALPYQSEQKVPKRGTLAERRAWTAARAEESRERDARRLELGRERGAQARLTVPDDKGFLVVPSGGIAEAAAVVTAATERIESIGHDRLLAEFNPKGDAMSREFLPAEAYELDSPYFRFALSESVIDAVSGYLGMVPVLYQFDLWYSPAEESANLRNAQLWHFDGDDTRQLKVWVHVDEIGPDSGPLTVLDASTSEALAEDMNYDSRLPDHHRIADERVTSFAPADAIVTLTGPAGTVDFTDTSRCVHLGSRVAPGAPPRRIFQAQYLTPYAMKLKNDFREIAEYRHLATDASSELEAMVLGAI